MNLFREKNPGARKIMDGVRARHPGFKTAVLADLRMNAANRGERYEFRSKADALFQIIRLCWVSDAFLAQVLYRAKAAMQRRGIPILPRICHRLMMALSQITIGDPVVIHPGVYLIHGQMVIDGLVEIHSGAVIGPWTSIGLVAGHMFGPTIHEGVAIGTGAKLLGEFEVGPHAKVGANAVVVKDVPAGATVVGIPAREVTSA
jgi:serine O-acetyltransferase